MSDGPMDPSQDCEIEMSFTGVEWSFPVSLDEEKIIYPNLKAFLAYMSQRKSENESDVKVSNPLVLASAFLDHLLRSDVSRKATRLVFQAFERMFLHEVDIHTITDELGLSTRAFVLKTYFMVQKRTNAYIQPVESALLKSGQIGKAQLYAVCGGQSAVNLTCLKELRELNSIYKVLLEDLIDVAAHTLDRLVHLPSTIRFYERYGFDIKSWLKSPQNIPSQNYIASAPLSFPIIGLLSLSHYCIACKTLGKSPGELRNLFQGVAGHSQGIIAAATIARSSSWASFYSSTKMMVEILFWIGFECHHATPASSLSAANIKDCIEAEEGHPSSMLSISGIDQPFLEGILQETNHQLAAKHVIYLALINSRTEFVIAGPPRSLRGFNLKLRTIKATGDSNQSRIPYHQRKPAIQHQFLPVTAAFHTPYLSEAVGRILVALKPQEFLGSDLGTGLYHTNNGEDLRQRGSHDITETLVKMVTSELVDWPKVTRSLEGSHILDFGPGRIGALLYRMMEGAGVRVIIASDLSSRTSDIGSKSEIFAAHMPPSTPDWGKSYKPRLVRDTSGELKMETRMSRLFGTPPVMVAGMTPTTVPWDYVSTISRAGYHVELAGGGYSNANEFESAIRKLTENVPTRWGITCNLIYANPKAIAWQIPLIRRLILEGLRIEGLTIGAGVPSAEIASEYIETIGLKHISFKPGSLESILLVIEIAKAHPRFVIGLQWTGGRSGGHHSFEDFHAPILKTYGQIRKCSNIVLIAGSGFGGASDTYPYFTGEWSRHQGCQLMPFDGVLLGSRMMTAKEAHTSPSVKNLIIEAQGVPDSEWHNTYQGVTGDVLTVKSEMGQPIHKLATRGVILWNELEQDIFSVKDQPKRLSILEGCKSSIVERLNDDYQKPWFAVNSAGDNVELEDMTYLEVLKRLILLMYVRIQRRWIDESYEKMVFELTASILERLVPVSQFGIMRLNNPDDFLDKFLRSYPSAQYELLHPEDVSILIGLFKQRGQKPVNFIPRLDENFENWFKKDSLWQAEDIDAVVNQDAQRVCIIHGPVAAQYSKDGNETAQAILDGISKSHIAMLKNDLYPTKPALTSFEFSRDIAEDSPPELDGVVFEEYPKQKRLVFAAEGTIPPMDDLVGYILPQIDAWAQACFADTEILQGQYHRQNPIRSALVPCHSHIITIDYDLAEKTESINVSTSVDSLNPASHDIMRVSSVDNKMITVTLFDPTPRDAEPATVVFWFYYNPEGQTCRLEECLDQRNERIKIFYAKVWLGYYPTSLTNATLEAKFSGGMVTLTSRSVKDFMSVVEDSNRLQRINTSTSASVPLDLCIVVAWDALVKPLLILAMDVDLLRLLHLSNEFEYFSGAKPISIGEDLETTSRIRALTIQEAGKSIEIVAIITRQGAPVVQVISTFLIQGSYTDFKNTFRNSEEPEMKFDITSDKHQELLVSRPWLDLHVCPSLLRPTSLIFRLETHVRYDQISVFDSIHVTGGVYSRNTAGLLERVGVVDFQKGLSYGNPVMDFLDRHGRRSYESEPLQRPGWNGDSSWNFHAPKRNSPYAGVSRDTNPIHLSSAFSQYVNLPGTITHGMYTSAAVRSVVEHEIADGDFARFRRYSANFVGMVMPGDKIRVDLRHVGMIRGRMVLDIQAFNDKTGRQILEAKAEVEQATTAYVFTGQGSQERGMGMALYDSSSAAKGLWDEADGYLSNLYGNSY